MENIRCPDCDQTFCSRYNLLRHRRNKHSTEGMQSHLGVAEGPKAYMRVPQGAQLRALGAHLGAPEVHLGAPGAHVGAPGAHVGAQGAHLGALGAHVGAQGAPLGALGAHLGAPEVHLGAPGVHVGAQGAHLGALGAHEGAQGAPLGAPSPHLGAPQGGSLPPLTGALPPSKQQKKTYNQDVSPEKPTVLHHPFTMMVSGPTC